ncbi:XRE family transcriptional regulator [Streptomyces griseoviridis]
MTAHDGGPRKDLSDLVRRRRLELGLSWRSLSAACVDPEQVERGSLWGRTTLDTLSRGGHIKTPKLPELRALAAGLQLTLGEVQEANGSQFYGVDTVWSADGEVRALVEGYREMDPEDQARVRDFVESRRRVKRA